jgi:hypothetical protein
VYAWRCVDHYEIGFGLPQACQTCLQRCSVEAVDRRSLSFAPLSPRQDSPLGVCIEAKPNARSPRGGCDPALRMRVAIDS